jgi:Abnormal spindle-like microcephaly-assoc'd, ASPM-SPD-2-Hydin
VTLTSSGSSPLTVNSAAVSGTGFSLVAGTLPTTLNPNTSMTLQLQFKPTASGSATGALTIGSNSTTGSSTVVSLSGTGAATTPQLSVSATSLNLGSVALNTATTGSVTLTSTGTSAVTVNSAAISGTGFSIVGGSFPVSLNPSQTLAVKVQFDPTTAGSATGSLTINSNSTTGSSAVVALSGTGTATPAQVNLSWSAPASSSDPVVGYNVYRALGSGAFQLVNSSIDTMTTYVDTSAIAGDTYNYLVKSIDQSGVESVSSNEITVAVP